MGGGGICSVVLNKLRGAPGVSIKVIEKDRGRARALAASATSNVMVLEGDAADLNLLREETHWRGQRVHRHDARR